MSVFRRLVLGAEAEFQGPHDRLLFDSFSPFLLYRAIDPDEHPVGLGVELQASIGRGGTFNGVDARAIVERRAISWWLQGNLILRNAREDGSDGTSLAYAASVQRSLGGGTWLGIEASGQLKRLDGATELAPEGRHYAGPSFTPSCRLVETKLSSGSLGFSDCAAMGPGQARGFLHSFPSKSRGPEFLEIAIRCGYEG